MGKFIDLSGEKFGLLTVVRKIDTPEGKNPKYTYWLCKCDCGNDVVKYTDLLRSGKSKSCGCIPRSNKGRRNGSCTKEIYSSYRSSARSREINFDLNIVEFEKLISCNCEYCGAPPSNKHTDKYGVILYYNGVDRINSKLGYAIDNVVSCCNICNKSKRNLNKSEFYEHINNIYLNLTEKGLI